MKKLSLLLMLNAFCIYAFAQNFQWAKSVGGTFTDIGQSIKYDALGNVYVSGTFQGTVDFNPGSGVNNLTSGGGTDFFILKLDVAGNFIWVRRIGGGGEDWVRDMEIDASGNVYTGGHFEVTVDFDPGALVHQLVSAGNDDVFISKLDSSGNFVYAQSAGSVGQDEILCITIDASGNLYASGNFAGTVDFDPGTGTYNLTSSGTYDIFILKLGVSGNFLWAKSMGGSNDDFPYDIALDAAGNVYSTGYFLATADFDPGAAVYNLTPIGSFDSYVCKLDAAGNFVWAKSMGGTGSDESQSIVVDVNSNVYVAGYFYGTADFDPGAAAYNLTSAGLGDIFILKLDAAGNFVWAKRLGGTDLDNVFEITLDAAQNLYITGYFQATVDFDPGTAAFNLSSAGLRDIFISKLDVSGNFLGADRIGGSANDLASSMDINASGNICLTGYFTGMVDFNSGSGVANLTSTGDKDVFMLLPGNLTTGIKELTKKINLEVYPNPAKDAVIIHWNNNLSPMTELVITDLSGSEIKKITNFNNSEKYLKVDVHSLSAGFYHITLGDEKVKASSIFLISK